MISDAVKINGKNIHNRIVLQPMEGCDAVNGGIGELTERRYMRFSDSGAGIIWFEATAVSSECRANPRQLFLNSDTGDSFRRLVEKIKENSLKKYGYAPTIILQLTHSGRFSKPNGVPEPIVAYRNELWEKGKEFQPYKIADDDYCDRIPEKYYDGAVLAEKCGFDGIDVKCCHGYLFDEFLSAYDRKGKYGGSLENRTRLYFDSIDAVKSAVSQNVFVTTRFNACDCFPYPYGFGVNEQNEIDLSETKLIIRELQKKGIELIDLTIGNPYLIPHINRPCINAPEDGNIGIKRIFDVTSEIQHTFPDMKFVMSGLSYLKENAIDYAEEALNNGDISFAGFGRMAFAYPEFYRDYLENGELNKNKCCLRCSKCTELMRHGTVAGCPVRDSEVYMPYYKKYVLNKGE